MMEHYDTTKLKNNIFEVVDNILDKELDKELDNDKIIYV